MQSRKLGVGAGVVVVGALDVSATIVVEVNDKGGAHVHGAVNDQVCVNDYGAILERLFRRSSLGARLLRSGACPALERAVEGALIGEAQQVADLGERDVGLL